MSHFTYALRAAAERNRSYLCVGLDPTRLPAQFTNAEDGLYDFCMAIVEATADLACTFKPNIAFFEAHGPAGISSLRRLIADMPRSVPVIVDAKRGDIGSTAAAYAQAIFDQLGADAVTLSPYLGGDALAPFLALGIPQALFYFLPGQTGEWRRYLVESLFWVFLITFFFTITLTRATLPLPTPALCTCGVALPGWASALGNRRR